MRFGKSILVLFVLSVVCGMNQSAHAQAAHELQEQFFDAIASEDPEQLLALCRDDLRHLIDEPVLAAWMKAMHAAVGGFERLDISDFRVSYSVNGDGTEVSVGGTVVCTKGTATSELVSQNGKLISWKADSELLPEDWFQGPLTTELYQQRGGQFILLALAGATDKAYDRMHPALQNLVSREDFAEMIEAQQADGGAFGDLRFQKTELDFSDGQRLNVYFEIEMENVTKNARIQFQFVGMQGHLIAYRFWNP